MAKVLSNVLLAALVLLCIGFAVTYFDPRCTIIGDRNVCSFKMIRE
jgi:hypothetical protein